MSTIHLRSYPLTGGKRFHLKLGAAMAVLFHAVAAISAAQEAPTIKKYALSELVGMALKNTQLLSAQNARVEQIRLSAAQSRIWAGPSVGLLAGRTKQTEASGSRMEFSVAQPLPLTGIPRLRAGLLDLQSESAGVQRAASEVLVTLSVAQGAYEYTANRRKAAFAEKRRKRFELIESYLSGRVFATPQRMAERHIVSNQLKNLIAEAILGEAGYKTSLEKLKAFVPLDAGNYPEIEVPWLSGARAIDEKELLTRALAENPELRAQRLILKETGIEKALASKEGLPDTSLLASFENGQADIIGTDVALGVSLAFPSWNRNRLGVKSAEQKRLAEERMLNYAEQTLKAELLHALVAYEAARQVVLKYPLPSLAELEGQLKAADEGFRKGQVDLLTFLELDGSVTETYGRVLDAQADLAAKAAEVLALSADRDALSKLASF